MQYLLNLIGFEYQLVNNRYEENAVKDDKIDQTFIALLTME